MKNEHQIRRLIDLCKEALDSPCDCAGTEHQFTCDAGRRCIIAQQAGLRWVLGEISDADILRPLTPSWLAEDN